MPSSVLNSPPEASLSLDPTATALDWLAHQTGGSITGCCDDAQSDRVAPEGSAPLPDFLAQLGPDDPWPILHDLTLRGAIEFRFLDGRLANWTPWFDPTTPGAPLDVAGLIARARSSVAPTRPSEPAEDPVHAAGLERQMDEHKARRAAEGITITPFTLDDDDTMQPGEVDPFMAPLVRLTARGLDILRTPSTPVVQGPPKRNESETSPDEQSATEPQGYNPKEYITLVQALELWHRPDDYKAFNKVEAAHSIRTHSPSPRRRMVHLQDWRTFLRKEQKDKSKLLDQSAAIVDEISRIHARKAQIRAQK